jgi:PAS domain S-box-containing protein
VKSHNGIAALEMKIADPRPEQGGERARDSEQPRVPLTKQQINLAGELALVIGAADTLERALQLALRRICETTGWMLGEAWIRSGSKLEPSPAWYASDSSLEPFRAGGTGLAIDPGFGLPGRAWVTKKPIWMRDVSSDPQFLRKSLATEVGLGAGMAVPVLSDDEVVAVLVFFVSKPREEDEQLIQLVSAIGAQLGALIRRRQADEGLRRSEEQLRAIAETAVDAIVSANSDGNITYFNRSAERIFGYNGEEVMGKPLTLIMPKRFHTAHQQGLERFLRTGEGRLLGRVLELSGITKDGQEFPLELAISHWSVAGKSFFTAVLRDISERKAADEALRQSDLMKTALLRSVSHDFRSPLTAIVAAGESIGSLRLEPKARRELATVIVGQASRLAGLVDKLLDLSRLRGGAAPPRRVSCSVEEIIEAALDQLGGEPAGFELALPPELPSLCADAAQLERAFANLLENARRYSNGQPVRISAEALEDRLVVRVADRGPGIPESDRERVFEPFYQADAGAAGKREGSGLGLAIVKGFVEANGGRVSVEPRSGQGATFLVELPLDEVGAAPGTGER